MNLELIKKYCDVHAIIRIGDHFVVYYHDGGHDIVETDIYDDGEQVMFSCNSDEEFADLCEVIESYF